MNCTHALIVPPWLPSFSDAESPHIRAVYTPARVARTHGVHSVRVLLPSQTVRDCTYVHPRGPECDRGGPQPLFASVSLRQSNLRSMRGPSATWLGGWAWTDMDHVPMALVYAGCSPSYHFTLMRSCPTIGIGVKLDGGFITWPGQVARQR
ncbi:hypothetical protein C8Q73DRAFT_40887 [Cubamyces lactineus]|nr:hypothetical protein C8Q73DRAFT_40887 [Cubamyces lactineus]